MEHGEIEVSVNLAAPFSMVPEVWFLSGLYECQLTEEQLGRHKGAFEHVFSFWRSSLNILFPEQFAPTAKDVSRGFVLLSDYWVKVASLESAPIEATPGHAWMVVFSHYLAAQGSDVTILSERPDIYRWYLREGHMSDVRIHGV